MRMLAPLNDMTPAGALSMKSLAVEVTTFCHTEPEVAVVPYGTTLPSSEVDVTLSGVNVKDRVIGTTNGLLRKSVYEPVLEPSVMPPRGALITPPWIMVGANTATEPPADRGVVPICAGEDRVNVIDAESAGPEGW